MKTPVRLGLTGGIGSGKSTVAARLSQWGAAVMDADAIAQSVTAPGGAAIAPLAQAFGQEFILPSGAMDRQKMRELVFQDPSAKTRLERIVHPLVGQETERQAQAALVRGAPCLVFDIPLLVEGGRWRPRLDRVLVVDCLPETQVERVVNRSQLTPAAVRGIMAAQASRAQRLAAADGVIYNDGIGLEALNKLVDDISVAFGLSSKASA